MLPGGRIEFFEDSKSAIKREIKEETGFDLEYELCSIQENFLEKDNEKIMQYCFCYKSIYNEDIIQEEFICNDNKNQKFYWVNINDLQNYKLLPNSVYELIKDSENIRLDGATTIYRTNKIIIRNPRKVNDELALHFYKISNIPEKSYYRALGVVAIMGYKKTAFAILRDKVNKNNIDEVLEDWNDFIFHKGKMNRKDVTELVSEIDEILNEIKSELSISINVDKEPYVKQLTNDKVVNLTGQSGSGKSTYANNNFNSDEYEIIDTDEIFSEIRYEKSSGLNKKIGGYFREKYDTLPSLMNDFDLIYKEILDYCKDLNKTIVIDCAQFHCIKDISILKGKIIIIRTSIDNCYNRTISRWINNHKQNGWDYTDEELNKYKERKKEIYSWYKETNNFIRKIDKL